eukprot:CAMPEP_0198313646 /NCGR_PEP_ID=MMETSP1450-20131203/4596_1 /TAXON_ID=753684 ORGANISM="Madagascaria erythrocladiodes, Strain CCMP3234" /NCGR_SAMPLE_ID=MMETSP1450 /ASSEMBLY_ACC=CAM_ASM_001115 /LENGTH=454 /DNA_ID=CAMNT_0044016655 /DNA_START=23 /DNA_END=1387 /DNA_ORIENTATION=-
MGVAEKERPAGNWGRTDDARSLGKLVTTVLVLFGTPPVVSLVAVAYAHFDVSLVAALRSLWTYPGGLSAWASVYAPVPTASAFALVLGWIAALAVLTLLVPGKTGYGLKTPAGHTLPYRVNGLAVFVLVHVLLGAAQWSGRVQIADALATPEKLPAVFAAASCVGYAVALLAYIKAHVAPTHSDDRKFSGSPLFDFLMGIELNPRLLGGHLDLKLFFIGKVGMISWSVVNLCFAAAQYRDFGYLSLSIVVSITLQTFYIVDFFVKEDWYLRTIDIGHDHFGWYLAWGDCGWLPFIYTTAAMTLSRHPVPLHPAAAVAILAIGGFAYVLFRLINDQKEHVRKHKGKCNIWGKPAQYLTASYTAKDGSTGQSLLLTSGWWGLARHLNYASDLLLSLMYCIPAGFSVGIVPYIYIIFMTILLVHRAERDQQRCSGKYGASWDEYCRRVPYKIIPGIY